MNRSTSNVLLSARWCRVDGVPRIQVGGGEACGRVRVRVRVYEHERSFGADVMEEAEREGEGAKGEI